MELLLLRHSMTAGNLKKQYIGATDQPLAADGAALARARAAELPPVERVWASPMLRCRQTAELLFPGQEPVLVPELRECDFGDFEGKTWEELKDSPVYRAWVSGDRTVTLPHGEAVGEFFARCRRGIAEVVEQASGLGLQRGAVVAHGGTWMAVLEAFGRPERGAYGWQAKNCGGWRVEVRRKPLELVVLEEL